MACLKKDAKKIIVYTINNEFNYENIKKTKSNLSYPSQLFINGQYQKFIFWKIF